MKREFTGRAGAGAIRASCLAWACMRRIVRIFTQGYGAQLKRGTLLQDRGDDVLEQGKSEDLVSPTRPLLATSKTWKE